LKYFLLLTLPQLQQQMAGLSQDLITIVCLPACDGEQRLFKSVKQKDMWKRLHMKKCSVCAGATQINSVKINLSQKEALSTKKESINRVIDSMNEYNYLLKS
jgi:hypothetical protein